MVHSIILSIAYSLSHHTIQCAKSKNRRRKNPRKNCYLLFRWFSCKMYHTLFWAGLRNCAALLQFSKEDYHAVD